MTVDPHAYLGYGFVFDREPHEAAFLAITGQPSIEAAAVAFEYVFRVKVVVTEDRVYVVHPELYYAASWEPERCGVLMYTTVQWERMMRAEARLDFLPPEAGLLNWLLWADTTTIED